MRLAQIRSTDDATLGELHERAGDVAHEPLAADGVRVVARFVGDGWLLRWLDADTGTPDNCHVQNEIEMHRALLRLCKFGCLPWRPRVVKTLRGLSAVGV